MTQKHTPSPHADSAGAELFEQYMQGCRQCGVVPDLGAAFHAGRFSTRFAAPPQAVPADEAMRKDADRWRSVEAMVSEVHGGNEFMVLELSARAKPGQHLKAFLANKLASLVAQRDKQ